MGTTRLPYSSEIVQETGVLLRQRGARRSSDHTDAIFGPTRGSVRHAAPLISRWLLLSPRPISCNVRPLGFEPSVSPGKSRVPYQLGVRRVSCGSSVPVKVRLTEPTILVGEAGVGPAVSETRDLQSRAPPLVRLPQNLVSIRCEGTAGHEAQTSRSAGASCPGLSMVNGSTQRWNKQGCGESNAGKRVWRPLCFRNTSSPWVALLLLVNPSSGWCSYQESSGDPGRVALAHPGLKVLGWSS